VASIKVLEHVQIKMPDGCRLSARIWLPQGAEQNPVPAILEYIPYRYRDFTALRDARIHQTFAREGYASVRVDLRGSGNSEGVLRDEYLAQELDDGVAVIEWLAEQPWCSGKVGVFGLSWGGFNGLMLAARRPAPLAAVISVCSSDDRYADDVHYMGGCLLTDNLSWASNMFAYNACPPDPELVGPTWRDEWLKRLDQSGLWLVPWLEHQHRDDYWKHASVCEDYEAIEVPVYAVGGWADGYTNTVLRLVENLKSPCKGLIGAWGHKYPHQAAVGTPIGFLSECVRWWDRWLKGDANGIDQEPKLRVWMQDSISPLSPSRPGRWVAEERWPSPDTDWRTLHLGPRGLSEGPAESEDMIIQSPLSVGLFAGKWYSYAGETDLPFDQREEDGGALVFDSAPLDSAMEVLGAPALRLRLKVDRPVAMIAARLGDVAPDGAVTRVTYGVLNLTHRHSHETPEALPVDEWFDVELRLNHFGQRFQPGRRIRVALSTSYWPLIWPSPEPVRMQVRTGDSALRLPVRPPRPADDALSPFSDPREVSGARHTLLEPARKEWSVVHNLATNESALQIVNHDMSYRLDDIDWSIQRRVDERYAYRNYRYDSVKGEVTAIRAFRRGDWSASTHTRTVLTCTPTHFRVTATLDAYEGESRIFAKSWDERIRRKLL